jgi:alcohol dehydrogenase (NADP+)
MIGTKGYAAFEAKGPLREFAFERRDVGPADVQIDIQYCGVCHSDLHTARNEWRGTKYPVVPGHEIVGRVANAGGDVKKFKEGDVAAVGCFVDSCRSCAECRTGEEQFCENGPTFTYNSPDSKQPGQLTYGGYSKTIVVDEAFVLRVNGKQPLPGVAPLLCAGITTYSPMRHWNVVKGQKVGVVGLGGLGHMAVKLAHTFGAHTVLFTTSLSKVADAKRLGADEVVLSKDKEQLSRHKNSFHFILDTVSASHNLDDYIQLLRRDGTLCLVGVPETPHPSPSADGLIMRRRSLAGSIIGGIRETQEMLDFCADRGIVSDVEVIAMRDINTAYERMLRSDVKYRFVIDLATLSS